MALENNSNRLRLRLKSVGLTDLAINAAWPAWWSQDAETSASARAELRFSIARKLGLDPHSLLEEEQQPRFVWRDEARFKHLSGETDQEKSAISSFGTAIGAALVNATQGSVPPGERSASSLREAILRSQPHVGLADLLSLCWSLTIPVIHLRVFPCTRKRMSAMSVRRGERSAILLGKDSMYPPHIAFYVAHELGHIALGHLAEGAAVVDLDYPDLASASDDPEEAEADTFALELLTGQPRPTVLPYAGVHSASELARTALQASSDLRIEPGTIALCFGYSTGHWATANAAMRRIYSTAKPAWAEVNKIALKELDLTLIPEDTKAYVEAVLGAPDRV